MTIRYHRRMLRPSALAVLAVLIAAAPAHAERCDGAQALATVRALCAAVDGGTDAELKARLRLPLTVGRITRAGTGRPRARTARYASVRAVRKARVCAGVDLAAATVTAEDAEQIVAAPRGPVAAAFALVARGDRCVVFRIDDR